MLVSIDTASSNLTSPLRLGPFSGYPFTDIRRTIRYHRVTFFKIRQECDCLSIDKLNACQTGEAWLGVSSFLNVERARRIGEPQDFRFADDFIPVTPLHIFVPAQAPHPNTARLFAAWLVTEGARIVERMDASSRASDPDSALAKALAARPPSSKIVEERSLADIKATRAITARIQALFTGGRR